MTHFRYLNPNVTLCGRAADGSLLSTVEVTTITEPVPDACPACQSAYERQQYCKGRHIWPWPTFVDGQACQCGTYHLVREAEKGVIFIVVGDEFVAEHADEIADLHPHQFDHGKAIEDLRKASELLHKSREILRKKLFDG